VNRGANDTSKLKDKNCFLRGMTGDRVLIAQELPGPSQVQQAKITTK
jgi:hypothetical protein